MNLESGRYAAIIWVQTKASNSLELEAFLRLWDLI